MDQKFPKILCTSMLAGTILTILLMSLALVLYPVAFHMIGIASLVFTFALLLIYGFLAIRIVRVSSQTGISVLHQGAGLGLVIGAIFIVDISVENFVDMSQQGSTISTFGFMALLFLSFAIAGFHSTQKTGNVRLGIYTSVLSAMIGVLIALIFGLALNFLFTNRLEQILLHSAEFARSQMQDIRAFTIYNTFDSASSHLVEVPIIAAVFGTIGAFINKSLISLFPLRTV